MTNTNEWNELAERFSRCPQVLRDWAEGLGYQALKARVDSGAAIAAQANTALALMLAGMAGCLVWGLKVLEPGALPVAWGAAAVAAYLALVAMATVHWCINLQDAPALYNRPGNLVLLNATLEQVRMGELANLDERICQQTALNARKAHALNRARLAATASPAVFILAVVIARCV